MFEFQIAEKRREAKGKGEKERYINLNAEFQRRAKTDKKDFLSDQGKEIEENNRMGKTRDLHRKFMSITQHESVHVFLHIYIMSHIHILIGENFSLFLL